MPLRVHYLSMGLAQAYLLEKEDGFYLVDAGFQSYENRVLELMQKLGGKDLRLIFISHAHLDHYGSAAALRRQTNAPITIHRLDAQAMSQGKSPLGSARGRGKLVEYFLPAFLRMKSLEPTQPNLLVEDGESIYSHGLDARIIHLPGHTPGSTCLLVEERLAFVGDLLSTNGKPHIQRYYAHDWSLIPSSLAKLQSFQPEWIYPGHGRQPLDSQNFQNLVNQFLRIDA